MRLTSPSGEFSEWVEGDGEAYMKHNITEDGELALLLEKKCRVNNMLILLSYFIYGVIVSSNENR